MKARIPARMVDLRLIGRKEMPGAFRVLPCREQLFKNGFIHQHHSIALAIPHINGFTDGDHNALRRVLIFKSVHDSTGDRSCPNCLSVGSVQDLCFNVFRKRVLPRIVQKIVPLRKRAEQASVLPHDEQAEHAFTSRDL